MSISYLNFFSKVHHAGGGEHSRLVVNKMADNAMTEDTSSELSMEFRCFLVNKKTSEHICVIDKTFLFSKPASAKRCKKNCRQPQKILNFS